MNPNVPTGVRPQLGFVDAVKICLTEKYCDFNGRARRSEYWWFCLCNFVLSYVVNLIGGLISPTVGMVLTCIVTLGLLLPGLGVCVRRLHDIGKSGWLVLLALIPLVGAIILIVWYCKDSDRGSNAYGPSPKYN
ncbi:MAG: DUF805 domain-containing protein [Muribaculaceae bacterium]|nr:DUF805 domain-containing protein [Muribaculaceae bacterium]MBR1726230.1 DUF805 domain-containing protein [Muribaculaceae bacterium]